MPGLARHLLLTLRLNFRSWQPLVYGYLVPVFFLLAFGSIFKTSPPLLRELGQLLTITTLGGACFGLPTAMVSERDRGVWRRYRLLPAATSGIILSTMAARFVLVSSAGLLQILLAKLIYGMPMPNHPLQLLVAFVFVSFAFLAMGLVVAMLADTVPSVQALGQAIFLPMIIIGGVGVPLRTLPAWGQHVAGFLPGRYAVDALQSCVNGEGLRQEVFGLMALAVIGGAALLAGAKLFRWDMSQRISAGARGWAAVAVVAWAAVGLAAEWRGNNRASPQEGSGGLVATITSQPATEGVAPSTSPATATTQAATTVAAQSSVPPATGPSTRPAGPADWKALTADDANSITYDDLESDDSTVTPVAPTLDNLPEEAKGQLDSLAGKLADWKPGEDPDLPTRVRNLLAVAAIVDILQDPNEAYVPLVVFEHLKDDVPKDQLIKLLTWIAMHPDEGRFPVTLPELGFDVTLQEQAVRERAVAYGRKLLGRLLGKLPPTNVQK